MSTLSDLVNEINANLGDNTTQQITPAKVRQVLSDMVQRLETDLTNLPGGTGGGTINITGGGLGFNFSTRAEAVAANIPSGVTWFRTEGLRFPGDWGGGLFAKIDSIPAWTTPTYPSIGTSLALITSADGANWLLQPDGAIVRPTQFGADAFRQWDDPFDQWPFFEHCKYYLINFFTSQGGGGMLIPPGWYHFSKPHSNEGGGYGIQGEGSVWIITTIATGDAFQFQHAYGPNQTFGAEGEPYNGYFATYLGQEMSNDGRVYRCVQAGQPAAWNGTAYPGAPTGTANGQHDGTAIWDYVRPLADSEKMGKPGGGGLSGVNIWCLDWNDRTQFPKCSAVVMRTRVTLQYLYIIAFPHTGIMIAADGNGYYRGGGNCNNWYMNRVAAYYCGRDGICIGYSDANAGVGIDIDTSSNGGYGIRNFCFLENLIVGAQSAYDGNPNIVHQQYPGKVTYAGRQYVSRIAINGFEPPANYQSPPPDTNPNWMYEGGDGTWAPNGDHPAWSASNIYEPSGGYAGFDGNDRSVWVKLYTENGTDLSQFPGRNLILGGLLQAKYGGNIWNDGSWNSPVTVKNGVTNVGEFTTIFGGPRYDNKCPKAVFYAFDYENREIALVGARQDIPSKTDWAWRVSGRNMVYWTSPVTDVQFGTGAPQPWKTLINSPVFGDNTEGGSGTNGRAFWFDYQPPTGGAHARGEVVKNRDAQVGSPKGWVCTVSGTPGTWVSEGNL